MEPERWQRLWTLFHGALERPEGEARSAYLADACGADSTLRAELGSLLDAHAAGETDFDLDGNTAHSGTPLTFDFVAKAVTGHDNGVITLDVLEADDVERERRRQFLDEPYRSLLGHLRHESGHYYWMLLVDRDESIESFRTMFGDERQDYQAALSSHYAEGAPANWAENFVSAYASAHPWEDWAETWAHYLHMVDAVETAEAEGMEPRAAGLLFGAAWPFKKYDVYRQVSFESLIERWVPLSLSMNSLSRSLGHRDFYPFVISAPVRAKLAFVHRVVHAGAA